MAADVMDGVASVAAGAVPLLVVWAAATDILTRTVPNAIPLLLVAAFGVFVLAAGFQAEAICAHLFRAGLVLVCGFKLFEFNVMGGGDAKLLAAASLWTGTGQLFEFVLATAITGGALALSSLALSVAEGDAALHGQRTIPYAVAISASVLFLFPNWTASY